MKAIGTLKQPEETASIAKRRITKKGGEWPFYLSARKDSVFIHIGEPPKAHSIIGVYDRFATVKDIAEDISFMGMMR